MEKKGYLQSDMQEKNKTKNTRNTKQGNRTLKEGKTKLSNRKGDGTKKSSFAKRAVPSVRYLAYDTIYRVKYKGAYSNLHISQTIEKYRLDERDRGFYTELVYGTLENCLFLDYVIGKFSAIKPENIPDNRMVVLEMGLYQIHYMDGMQNFAAVNESVQLMKELEPQTRAYAFVNAMLRTVLRTETAFDIDLKDAKKRLSVEYSVAPWIAELMVSQYGLEKAEDIFYALSQHAKLYVRVNPLKTNTQDLKRSFFDEGILSDVVEGYPQMLKVQGFKNMNVEEHYVSGAFTVQDLSSVSCIEALAPQTGEVILDACAAPGGKATAIAEKMAGTGTVIAADKGKNKLALIEDAAKRLNLLNIKVVHQNACVTVDEWREYFDRVLVDVPCSGLGIIRRKPEIRYKSEREFVSLYDVQKSILQTNSAYVKKGGVLVYSTCTLDKRENERIVRAFLRENKNFRFDEFELPRKGKVVGMTELLPDEGDWDGFFICRMKRVI